MTQIQNAVTEALAALDFEQLPSRMPGAPSQFKVTANAIEALKDKTIVVSPDGSVAVK